MKHSVIFLLALLPAAMLAQSTTKQKSKDKIYEKGRENRGVKVRNLTAINSQKVDYSPNFYQNGLVFVSTHTAGPVDKRTGGRFHDLFFAPFDPNGEPIARQEFSVNLNSTGHEGPLTFSSDWNTVYFSRNASKPDAKGATQQQICEATRGLFDWEKIRPLPFNSDEYSCRHPALSPDGNVLYFSSDMPGGLGGFDLYRVRKEPGGGWSQPENLGPEINTDGREGFPFVHASGALFFASTGHNSMGGLDIFMAKTDGTSSSFTEITNLGEPFNSELDDLGLILNPEGTRGFFSSNRPNSVGEDDIFSVEIEDGLHGLARPASAHAGVMVHDAYTNQALQGAAIRVLERSKDGYASGGDFYDVMLQPDENGSTNLALRLVRKNADDLGPADLFSNAAGLATFDFLPGKDYLLVITMDGYKVGDKLYTGEENPTSPLDIALEPLPRCKPVRGVVKTDGYGTPINNAVVKFADRVSGKQELVRTNLNGEFDFCLGLDGDWTLLAEKEGFIGKVEPIKLDEPGKIFKEIKLGRDRIIGNDAPALAPPEPLAVGSIITLDKIYYDFNKATLNESACRQLEGLISVMKQYPSMEIDLLAHTDTRGSAIENQKLSDERARNAKIYMVARGISAERVNAIGMGESQPRNRCLDGVNCSDEEHAFNRRTEVRVRKINEGVKVEFRGKE